MDIFIIRLLDVSCMFTMSLILVQCVLVLSDLTDFYMVLESRSTCYNLNFRSIGLLVIRHIVGPELVVLSIFCWAHVLAWDRHPISQTLVNNIQNITRMDYYLYYPLVLDILAPSNVFDFHTHPLRNYCILY